MKPLEISFTPVDNQRLANLCGVLDENLRQVETALDVGIARRGERFTLTGSPERARTAAKVLQDFYDRARDPLSLDAVQLALIEAGHKGAAHADIPAPALITRKQDLHGRTPRQNEYLLNIQKHDITFSVGPAGTGKTYLAVACAVDALERDAVQRIILVRPAVEAGERLGFLPGDMREKVDPYLRPLYDALYDMLPAQQVVKRLESGEIEVAPLAFMRGRTLANAFVILDEAQNTTSVQMKMFLTRLGQNARMVVTGDLSQVDLPKGTRSGLRHAVEVLHQVPNVAFVHFSEADVVRHPLVSRIVRAYNDAESRLGLGARYESGPAGSDDAID
ncbi:MAG: PhoH family protein [Burkholderiales bacterium]|nr:PhoH family protein [Burkholderiales bacterium]